jgi:DNA-binding transcriptional LysR family regulator
MPRTIKARGTTKAKPSSDLPSDPPAPGGIPPEDPGRSKDSGHLRTTLYRLHCFEVAVEEGGFKRATARLHITQPALSYQMKQLERTLGAQLFYRRPGGIGTTAAGKLLFQHAQQVSAAVAQAKRALKELSETEVGEVRIGTINSVGIYFLAPLLWLMRERHPTIRPTVLYRESNDIVATVLTDQLDLAILADPAIDHRLRYETLFEDPLSLVCGLNHPLAGSSKLSPELLAEAQFVALSAGTPTGALIRTYCDRLGLAAEPAVSSDNVETVKRMVEIGMGVAFLPDLVTERDILSDTQRDGRLIRVPLDPPLSRRIVLVTWNKPAASRAVTAFIDEVRNHSAKWRAKA